MAYNDNAPVPAVINSVVLSGVVKSAKWSENTPGKPMLRLMLTTNTPFSPKTFNLPIVAFSRMATKLRGAATEGTRITVQGYIEVRSWKDAKTQTWQYMTEVVVQSALFPDGSGLDESAPDEGYDEEGLPY